MSDINLNRVQTLDKIREHKDNIVRKVKYKAEIEDSKKETAKAFNEQLKEISKDIESELVAITTLEDHLKDLEMTEAGV